MKKKIKSTFRFLGDREFFLALIGSILIIISVFLPWLGYSGFFEGEVTAWNFTKVGLNEPYIVLVGGIVGIFSLIPYERRDLVAITSGLISILGLIATGFRFQEMAELVGKAGMSLSFSYGVVVTGIGVSLLILSSIDSFR